MDVLTGNYINLHDVITGDDVYIILDNSNTDPTVSEMSELEDIVFMTLLDYRCGYIDSDNLLNTLENKITKSGLSCVKFGFQIYIKFLKMCSRGEENKNEKK